MTKQREIMTTEQIAQCYADGLREYIVRLLEAIDATEPILFECWATDEDHAAEQADNAYPNCSIIQITLIIPGE